MKRPFVVILLLFAACTKQIPIAPEDEKIVVQGFLYANNSFVDISLLFLQEYDGYYPAKPSVPINDAHVILFKNDYAFPLSASLDQDGKYLNTDPELTINANDTFRIIINYKKDTLSATTIVPPRPEITDISGDTLWVDFPHPDLEMQQQNAIRIKWQSKDESNAFYFVAIDSVNYDGIHAGIRAMPPYFNDKSSESPALYRWRFNEYLVYPTYYPWPLEKEGKYTLNVYRVNKELVDFYEDGDQYGGLSIASNSNVKNGYGIFTALNGDSVSFYIKKKM